MILAIVIGGLAGVTQLFTASDRAAGPAVARPRPPLPAPAGPATLAHPVAVGLDPPPAPPEPCPTGTGLRCTPPPAVLTVDEVTAVRAEDRGSGAVIRLSLPIWDAATLAVTARSATRLTARIGGGPPRPAAVGPGGALELPAEDRTAAAATVRALGVVAVPGPRLGKGPLGRPLEMWAARSSPGPCRVSAAPGARGLLVADRGAQCLQLRGPGVRLRSADDLTLAAPTGTTPYWVLSVVAAAPDRAALQRFTRDEARSRGLIAFVVGGRVVTGQSQVTGAAATGVQLGLADEAQGRLLVHRLRP